MDNITALLLIDNKTALLILMIVLIAFVLLLTVLGIVFIIALRKRRPVVKVVMAPTYNQYGTEPVPAAMPAAAPVAPSPVEEEPKEEIPAAVESEPEPVKEIAEIIPPVEDDDDEEGTTFVTEGHESVRYNRSFTAKLCQLNNESKEWYSELKNELLSYEKVRDRVSWKRESFRLGRMTVARLVVRGKTLCLLLAVEPVGYSGTKYSVEDVSNMANTVDTPTLYRIKSARRLKYAKEMIEGLMKEIKAFKKPGYELQDYFVPYEGDMSLMQRGLVKRVVSGSTKVYKIEEVDSDEQEDAGDGENL